MSSSLTSVENNALHAAILERGQFYCPAGKHYGNPDAAVTCDRCQRTNIPACVGFERFDYCLSCIEAIVQTCPTWSSSSSSSLGYTKPSIRLPPSLHPPVTRMMHDMYTRTLMAQDMFGRR